MKQQVQIAFLAVYILFFSNATAQVKVGKIDGSLWTANYNSVDDFDYASKMEILVYVKCFMELESLKDIEAIKSKYNIKSANLNSFENWRKEQIHLILQNLHAIKSNSILSKTVAIDKNCTWQEVTKAIVSIEKNIPTNLKAWYADAIVFNRQYVNELARLAFLFPRPSSEVLTIAPNEITGNNYKDKEFLLTFDDGPTPANGNTDRLMSTLKKQKLNGVFFVLGESLQNRINASSKERVATLYSGNKIGSHGKIHKSHQYLKAWQESLDFTTSAIQKLNNGNNKTNYFRPPYGQRTVEISKYLSKSNGSILLWNIDSQDWNSKITASEVSDRVIALMLLWRKGIILFHDVHSKASDALPIIVDSLNGSGVHFIDSNKL
ncbi:hypothetical protein FFWV33_10765 [Flavobacterium faecale]|uniref:NodB homology domain-containing protein n=1 Tax=Flavobacterium faecale TaxID=1355330 RepID=A0A2S1LEK0_9FLAO|nr:polysaccharide deacetylase family protein [Flavobacterium faecale]AWG21966.1 hypothetical protein FFWV33_10765 [Flavobacterium faecale]